MIAHEAWHLRGVQLETGYPLMPERYRSAECVDGGGLDLCPDDPGWP